MQAVNKSNKNEIFLIIAVFILGVVLISPLLSSGFLGDDSPNSLTKGQLIEENRSSISLTTKIISDWIHIGRFYPLAGWTYIMFNVLSNLFAYKLSVLFFVLSNLVLFYFFIMQFSNSRKKALLAVSIMPLLFQFRLYHDPILSFGWLMQVIFIYTFGSLLLLVLSIKKQKPYLYALSLIIYGASLFTYEITYTFFLLHMAVAYFLKEKDIKAAIKTGIPYMGLAIFATLTTFALRLYFKIPLSGATHGAYVPNFDVIVVIKTFIKQVIAALPLSYYYFDRMKIFSGFGDYVAQSLMISLIIILGYGLVTYFNSKHFWKEKVVDNASSLAIGVVGVLVLFLPGVLISLSTRYQSEVALGVGYLPVYIAYFGTSMVITSLVVFIFQRLTVINMHLARVFSIIIALSMAYIAIVNYNNNQIVVGSFNNGWLHPRVIIETALENGLFKNLPKDAVVLVDSNYPWDVSSLYTLHAGKKVRYLGAKGAYDLTKVDATKRDIALYDKPANYSFLGAQNIYYLRYISIKNGKGMALLGKIKSMVASKAEIKNVSLYSTLLYADYQNIVNEPIDKAIARVKLDSNLSPTPDYKNLKAEVLDDN